MKKLLFLNFCFITLLSCNSTSSSLTTSSFTSSLSSISSSSESNESSNEISSIEESSKETSYTKKIKIYLNPSVQVNNIYYCKTISEAESMNIVSKKIYEKLINEPQFEVYQNDRMLKLSDSVKEINSLNIDYHLALHTNAGGGSGSECYYYKNSTFAQLILKNVTNVHAYPNRGIKNGSHLYELKNSKAKNNALIEFLFHDNKNESQFIKNNYDLLAQSIVNSFKQLIIDE